MVSSPSTTIMLCDGGQTEQGERERERKSGGKESREREREQRELSDPQKTPFPLTLDDDAGGPLFFCFYSHAPLSDSL